MPEARLRHDAAAEAGALHLGDDLLQLLGANGEQIALDRDRVALGNRGGMCRCMRRALREDQTALMERFTPAVWVDGHVHDSFDCRVGGTLVIANPRGYWNENARFDPGLVIDVLRT